MAHFIRASNEASDFDQADLNCFLTRNAYKFRLMNVKSFWLLLHGYRLYLDPEGSINEIMGRYDGDRSLVLRVANFRPTRHEFRSEHGGLYRLNVEQVLQTSRPFHEFGLACDTIDDIGSERLVFPEAVDLAQLSELTSGSGMLMSVIQRRQRVFGKAFLRTVQHVSDRGIASAHTDVFNMHRSDLLVIDNDFLPDDNAGLLRSELACRSDINSQCVHLWYSRNPVNNLVYGHGGVKFFPREAQLLRRESVLQNDFTLSVGAGLVVHPVCLGTHQYNWSSFSTWITAAKEVAKLTTSTFTKKDKEAESRLQAWLQVFNPDSAFLAESKSGAAFGNEYPLSVMSADTADKQKALFANHFHEVNNG
jgi:hypothetical protein